MGAPLRRPYRPLPYVSCWITGLPLFLNTSGPASCLGSISWYKPGCSNTGADALSRRDELHDELLALSFPHFDLFNELLQEIEQSMDLSTLHAAILVGDKPACWSVVDELIIFDRGVYVAPTSASLPVVLQLSHGVG